MKKIKPTIPTEEIMCPGHLACQGCGGTLAMRLALKALGRDTMLVIPACCWSVVDGAFPNSSVGVPLFHTAFETAASVATGVRAALEIKNKKKTSVLAWAGDGGTFDIGLQALSGAAERNEDFIYVCYDNEAYMNTGVQRSSSTPYGSWTSTTPVKIFKSSHKKNIIEIMNAHKIPYIATASIFNPEDLVAKLIKAKDIVGTKYIHILAPCPVGWKFPSSKTIGMAKLAFETCIFPLYEIENGKYTVKKPSVKKPVKEYLKIQGRFAHVDEKLIRSIQENTDKDWEILLNKEIASKNC